MNAAEFVSLVKENKARVNRYLLGGDGTGGGCDCIGLIIGALRLGGEKWQETHGSNYAARYEMKTLEKIQSKNDLMPGHVVYKAKKPGESGWALPSRYMNHKDTNDYYHVGVVTSADPLEITHCTGVEGGIKIDASVGNWTHYGEIKRVSYEEEEPLIMEAYKVTGGKLALRQGASTDNRVILYIPDGERVEAAPREDGWSRVRYSGKLGYSMTKYLQRDINVPSLEERVAALEAWRKSIEAGGD